VFQNLVKNFGGFEPAGHFARYGENHRFENIAQPLVCQNLFIGTEACMVATVFI
jgi:hypothetical protein